MTGDVSINPDATCIVLTTEIMRSMIYRGSEIMREVKWVIFDEVHYMRDRERGVVWEESIIFAPPGVQMVFLVCQQLSEVCMSSCNVHFELLLNYSPWLV